MPDLLNDASNALTRTPLFRGKATALTVAKIRHIETIADTSTRVFTPTKFVVGTYPGRCIVDCLGHDLVVKKFNDAIPGLYALLVARTRLFDDEVVKAVSNGATQLVILGAGFDMRGIGWRSAACRPSRSTSRSCRTTRRRG